MAESDTTRGAAAERARIVAWLRRLSDHIETTVEGWAALDSAASAIERGEHASGDGT